MKQPSYSLGSLGRRAAVGFLIITSLAQPAVAGAQSIPPLSPPNLAGSTLPTSSQAIARGQDPYPRAAVPLTLANGVTVRPLRTVLTTKGSPALADRLLVSFKQVVTDTDLETVRAKANVLGAGNARALVRVGAHSFMVDVTGAGSLEKAARAYVDADPRVLGAGPDYMVYKTEAPNDPQFRFQWGPAKIQAPAAWNRTHGSPSKVIAILDSGLNDQGDDATADFAGKVIDHHDFTNSSVGTDDVDGHGTHVTGIAAAPAGDGQGTAGVSYSSNILVVKVLDDTGGGPLSAVNDGIYWAADHGASVINMSLGSRNDCSTTWWDDLWDTDRSELKEAIDYATSKNVVVVAAAGNDGDSAPQIPASCPNVLSVTSTGLYDGLLSGSTHGTWVDVAAPGSNIWSTAVPGAGGCRGPGGFANCSGTSMAAPHVSGLAALVQASCGLTRPQDVVDRITSTADPIAGTGTNWQYGRVNALNAVCFPVPGNVHLGTIGPSSIQVLWTDTTPGESSFQIGSRVTGSTALSISSVAANTTSFTHSGLASGVSYDHMVRACDAAGCSAWSNPVTATAGSMRLTVTEQGAGKVTGPGINCGQNFTDCTESYTPNTIVTLTATPVINLLKHIEWDLDHWEGACAGNQTNTCTLTMSSARTARAVFKLVPNGGLGAP